jgi:hypothetical protein
MTKRTTIFVAGYPKSGTVYITRLLGDVLDSQTGAYWDSRDREDIAAEGKHRKGPYIIRRGHFVLLDKEQPTLVPVPAPHKLAWKALTDQKLLCIMRDPRDIAVSAYFYFNARHWTIATVLKNMRDGEGPFRLMGPWNKYMRKWSYSRAPYSVCLVKFEQLVKDPFGSIKQIGKEMTLELPSDVSILAACDRQSFAVKKKELKNASKPLALGKYTNVHHMRKGIAGDWRNHFTEKHKRMAQTFFGKMMIELGYSIK